MDREDQISFHIMLLTAFTGMGILLDIIILVSGWGDYAVLPVTMAFLLCWGVHFIKIGSDDHRLYFYVIMILIVLGYYAFQGATITDVPILLCLFIIMLTKKGDKGLIGIVTSSYVFYLIGNFLFSDYLGPHMEQIVFSRIVLGVVCLFSACAISVYFIRQYEKVDEELAETKRLLCEAQKENELFLSNMSHELRTPINAVNGVSEILLNGDIEGKERRGVEVIQKAGHRLYQQVSDVLDYSEIETGHFALAMDEYEPISVIHDVVNLVKDKSVGLDFAIDVDAGLPRTLYGDAERLKKIMVALTDNALKFTDAGGVYLEITGREESYGINLNIDLWDTGCGMSEEQKRRLCIGSYLGDSSAERKSGGLGLGLSIVHGIVSAMRGFLSIQSTEGEGTHVHVSLPQEIRDATNSLSLEQADKYRVVCYFNREKYVRSEVGVYYYQMIEHMRKGLGLHVTMATSLQEMKELCDAGMITHLYVANWEYEMEPSYFEQIAKTISVCVFANHNFSLPQDSKIDVIYKPIFALAVINQLKATLPGVEKKKKKNNVNKTGNRKRALVVDDEEMNLVVARGILEQLGLSAEVCSSGGAAIEKCRVADYDIIFMDYMMPQMNGTTAMKQIRKVRNQYYKDKPIIVFTANAVSGAKEGFLRDGFDDFLSKPIDLKHLKKILKKHIAGGMK